MSRRAGTIAAAWLTMMAMAPAIADVPDKAQEAMSRALEIRRKFDDPQAGVLVVAHRGCHNPAPRHGLPSAPENSFAALENCVRLGVDMMETDVRRSKDGVLVIIHDATVDRTTDGVGKVADLTLAELKRLHLRQNFGGRISPVPTEQRVLTLDEILAAARGRIMLNLDIKEPIYAEVIAAARAAGMIDQVLVKSEVSDKATPVLADEPPYRDALYMPILWARGDSISDPAALIARQSSGQRHIPAVELVLVDPRVYPSIREAAHQADIRIWVNTLTSVGVIGIAGGGGDLDALRDHGRTWRNLIEDGVSVIQTDEPEALLDFLGRG